MKKNIYFSRHGRLNYQYSDHSQMSFELLCKLASGEEDPEVHEDIIERIKGLDQKIDLKKIEVIYFNNSGQKSVRTRQTAQKIQNYIFKKYQKKVQIIGINELKEVEFNLDKICRKNDYKQYGMIAVRKTLYNSIINEDSNSEKYSELVLRVKKIVEKLKKNPELRPAIVVTHDFLMQFIMELIKNNYQKPTLENFDISIKSDYVNGFISDDNLKEFELIKNKGTAQSTVPGHSSPGN